MVKKLRKKRADNLRSPAPKVVGRPFVQGFDPRRNLSGPPKDHDELKKLIREIAATMVPGAPDLTRLQMMILRMLSSDKPLDRIQVLEHGWGKVKEEIEATVRGALPVEAVDLQKSISHLKPTDE